MVVGRAVHGWSHGFSLKNEHNIESRMERFHHGVSKSIVFHNADKEKYFTPSNRSALWRVSLKVADRVTNVIQHPQNVFYSNLYRVSNQAWNPSGGLRNVQLELCKQILAAEVKIFRPKLILILTGYDWAKPFTSYLDCSLQSFRSLEYVEKAGRLDQSIVVVSKHPMAKPEEPQVKELLSTITSCKP